MLMAVSLLNCIRHNVPLSNANRLSCRQIGLSEPDHILWVCFRTSTVVKDLVRLGGCFRLLFLYDVAEAIDLELLRNLLGTRVGPMDRPFPRRTPQYVRFEHAPIIEPAEPLPIGNDTVATSSVKH
jgi:hypothetical protein